MDSNFNFNFKAAQYANFENLSDDEENLAEYFDQDHEGVYANVFLPSNFTPRSENHCGELRRSVSVGHLNTKHFYNAENCMSKSLRKLKIQKKKLISSHQRSVSTNNVSTIQNKLKLDDGKFVKPFVSMAEQIVHFQQDTPDRFRTKSVHENNKKIQKTCRVQNIANTIPQSPALSTKNRKRTVLVLSQKEIEDLEVEEIKKCQFKANNFNKDILKPTVLPKIEKKPTTQLEPFNLTEVHKKPIKPSTNVKTEFVARPLPSKIFEKVVGVKEVPKKPLTEPVAPKIHTNKCTKVIPITDASTTDKKVVMMEIDAGHGGITSVWANQNTRVQPFSFEQRDKELLRKKQEKIEKVFEEEKKARQFHANPIPTWIKSEKCKQLNNSKDKSVSGSSVSTIDENVDSNNTNTVFKARPPTVLYKEPFKPVKQNRPTTEIVDFHLNTDKRAEERKLKNEMMKEKKAIFENLKQEFEELLREKEEKEIAELRKAAVPKANPVRKFKAFQINPSTKKLTDAKSPKISSRMNKTITSD